MGNSEHLVAILPDNPGRQTFLSPSRGISSRHFIMLSSSGSAPPIVSGLSSPCGNLLTPHIAQEERSKRRGYSAHVTDAVAPRQDITDTTAVPNAAQGSTAPVHTAPLSTTSNDQTCGVISRCSSPAIENDGHQPSLPATRVSNDQPGPTPDPVPQSTRSPLVAAASESLPSPPLDTAESVSTPHSIDRSVQSPAITGGPLPPSPPNVIAEGEPPMQSHTLVAGDTSHHSQPVAPIVTPQQSSDSSSPPDAAGPTQEGSAPDNGDAEDSTITPPSSDIFKFGGTSAFITQYTLEYFGRIPGGRLWTDMIEKYLQLEETSVPLDVRLISPFPLCFSFTMSLQSPLRLPTLSRPAEVGTWLKNREYTKDRIPHVPDAGAYAVT